MVLLKKQNLLNKTFGVGIKTAKKIYSNLHLNVRKMPILLKKSHVTNMSKILQKLQLGQELKNTLAEDVENLKKIKTYKSTISKYRYGKVGKKK